MPAGSSRVRPRGAGCDARRQPDRRPRASPRGRSGAGSSPAPGRRRARAGPAPRPRARVGEDGAEVDVRLEILWVPARHLAEVPLGGRQVPALEGELAEKPRQLGVATDPPQCPGQHLGGALRLAGEQRQLGRLQRAHTRARRGRAERPGPRHDDLAPLAQLVEQFLAGHLGGRRALPRGDHLGLADDLPAVEKLDQRLHTGVEERHAALQLRDPLVDVAERRVHSLEGLLAGRQALEDVLVERLLLALGLAVVLVEEGLRGKLGVSARDDEQRGVAAQADLPSVGVRQPHTTGRGRSFPPTHPADSRQLGARSKKPRSDKARSFRAVELSAVGLLGWSERAGAVRFG